MAKHNIIHSLFKSFFLCLSVVLGLFSCKKTETIGLPPQPQNLMLEYKVTNLPDTVIYGAIDHVENSVTVYIPYYYALDQIDAEITVQPEATLESEVLPVFFNEAAPSYTVRGADGSTRAYDLRITQQNPPGFSVSFYSVPPEDLKPIKEYPNSTTNVWGDLYSTSAATLKAKLTNRRTGKVTTLDDLFHQKITPALNGYWFPLPIPAEVDSGFYDVEIGFLGNTSKVREPLEVAYQEPRLSLGVTTVVKGRTSVFKAERSRVLLGATKVTVNIGGAEHELPIVRADLLEVEVRIPEDFPVGNHGRCTFTVTYSGWSNVVKQPIPGFRVNEG